MAEHGNGLTKTSSVLDLILKSAGVITIIGALLSGLLYVQLQPVQAQITLVGKGNEATAAMVERYMANRRNIDSLVCVTLRILSENARDLNARMEQIEKKIQDRGRR